jgi:hypothetical protein
MTFHLSSTHGVVPFETAHTLVVLGTTTTTESSDQPLLDYWREELGFTWPKQEGDSLALWL